MDPTAVDPSGIEVPIFDEDPDENFTGPEGLGNFLRNFAVACKQLGCQPGSPEGVLSDKLEVSCSLVAD